jgi:hypothetical protein
LGVKVILKTCIARLIGRTLCVHHPSNKTTLCI